MSSGSSEASLSRVGAFGGQVANRLGQAADRWLQILRYHRTEQLVRRASNRVRERLAGFLGDRLGAVDVEVRPIVRNEPTRDARVREARIRELRSGRLTLLNRTVVVGRPIRWRMQERESVDPLWEFALQYHEYLGEIAGDEATATIVGEVIESWLSQFGTTRDTVAWHPYCISRRIPVWAELLFRGHVGVWVADQARASLAQQAEWLRRRLERDIGGNHLWENARGLIIAGCYFCGASAERWRNTGRELLNHCLQKQLLPWGEHYERSPGYQADLVRGLIEVAEWIRPIDRASCDDWLETARKMEEFLDTIRHPDGGIALFGDSTLDTPEARGRGPAGRLNWSSWTGEYYVHRVDSHQLIFDAGNMGPDDLPAHSHADLLTWEMTAYGKRLVVDSGVCSYSGRERRSFRGTQAHNVLIVDGKPLADVWSSFRMGRRGHVMRRSNGRTSEGRWVSATHNAYSWVGVPFVHRIFFFVERGPWFCVDIMEPVDGRWHDLESVTHFGPSIQPESIKEGRGYRLLGTAGTVVLEAAGGGLSVESSRYSERFHSVQGTYKIVMRSRCREMSCMASCFSFWEESCQPAVSVEGDTVCLGWESGNGRRLARIPIWSVGGAAVPDPVVGN